MKKNLAFSLLVFTFCLVSTTSSFASEVSDTEETTESLNIFAEETSLDDLHTIVNGEVIESEILTNTASNKDLATTISRTEPFKSGNAYEWNYCVTSEYSGDKKVDTLRNSLQGSAMIKNNGQIMLTASSSNELNSDSNAWNLAKSDTQYFELKDSGKNLYRTSNLFVAPARNCKEETLELKTISYVKLKGDPQAYEVSVTQ